MNELLKNKLDNLFLTDVSQLDNEGLPVINNREIGVNEMELNKINNFYNNLLPLQYLEFLQYTNGCTLFNYKDLGGILFFSTNKIIEANQILFEGYEEYERPENLVAIGITIGEGDYIVLKILDRDNHQILDGYHDFGYEEWKPICNSFENFINRLIDEKGKRYWL